MRDPPDEPLTPAQARVLARARWLMLSSGLATLLGIAVVIGVISYRVFRSEGSSAGNSAEVTALLPKGARIVQTAVAGEAIVVTLEVGGALEIRTFDAKTLRPTGRLKFAVEP